MSFVSRRHGPVPNIAADRIFATSDSVPDILRTQTRLFVATLLETADIVVRRQAVRAFAIDAEEGIGRKSEELSRRIGTVRREPA